MVEVLLCYVFSYKAKLALVVSIWYYFSSLRWRHWKVQDLRACMDIARCVYCQLSYAGLPFLQPQFNECFSGTINNCRGTVDTMRRGPILFASRIRSQGRAGTKHLLGSISNFASVCIKLNQESHPSCSSMHQQWRATNCPPKWTNQCIVARW